jgi:pimeloyl-ACP methyl ester carboxylesterase
VLVSGASIHVVEAGEPGAGPFAFLHGCPESWRSWEAGHDIGGMVVYAYLLAHRNVVRADAEHSPGAIFAHL